jgi:hypothetical protein
MPDGNALHIPGELLADYTARRLSEAEELDVEAHLAECDECSEVARAALLVGNVWDNWTAQAHGQAFLASRLSHAIRQAQHTTANAGWQVRLDTWAEEWTGRVEAAVRVVMAAPGSASRVVTEGLEALSRPGTGWQFAAVPVGMPTRGPRAQGKAPSPTVALASGTSQARVAVGGARREIVVRLDALPGDRQPPLVLLVSVTEDDEPRLAIPEQQPGAPYFVARFDDVPPGEYVVAFEPLPNVPPAVQT